MDRALSDQHPNTKKEASNTLKIFLHYIQTPVKLCKEAGTSCKGVDASSTVIEEESKGNSDDKICELEKSITKRLIHNCYHQHSKLRSESFSALHDLILLITRTKDSESALFPIPYILLYFVEVLFDLEEKFGKLFFHVAFDRIASVRKTAYSVLINWIAENM